MKRFIVTFSGRVQGVGFRYTSKHVARGFDVVGTVQNLPDGRVKMILEGERHTVEQFVASVCEATHGNVADTEMTSQPSTGEFIGFEIVR